MGVAIYTSVLIYDDENVNRSYSYSDSYAKTRKSKTTKSSTTHKTTHKTTKTTKKSTTIKKSTTTYKTKVTTTYRTTIATIPPAQFPIDINLVTYDELIQIGGVGDSTANKILSFRSSKGVIRNMDCLLEIDGIGNELLSTLKEYLYVSDSDYQEITYDNDDMQHETVTRVTKYTEPADSVTEQKYMRKVNINNADANEISNCLLIDNEQAEKIVEFRDYIHYYSNPRELLYIDGFTIEFYNSIKDYIEV